MSLRQLRTLRTKCYTTLDSLKSDPSNEAEIDELSIYISDIDDIIEAKQKAEEPATEEPVAEEPTATATEEPVAEEPAAEEKKATKRKASKNAVVKLQIVYGQRFDPRTGKEISKQFVQAFNYAEALNFSRSYKQLGYRIIKVIDNPFEDIKF